MIELYPLLLAGSGDSSAAGFLFPLLAGPAVFAAVYGLIYRYYRNTDKRHVFEKETEVRVGNLRSNDRKVGENNRQSSARMNGDNTGDHLRRVQRIRVE
ncbi:hypothetical protein V1260_11890 [Brachybacterium sp. J144]|uniref:hypothetical protein n=1 Tax=unclassified Brachybacterium TaxID=2623841 RepID=UPI002E7664B9|nr:MULTISPECIES: hypothetical protein [unclassified Brachybacterium]MEE1619351.1 hypothetical protein [Brachybacterium sp. J153]MEE1651483.1 hypothetical protein [Brachybacterium sp. J144]